MTNGYRLPDAAHVGRVHLGVADLGRSLAFYEGVLGMHVRESAPGEVDLAASTAGPALVRLHERPGAPGRRSRTPGLFHYALLVPGRQDLARVLLRLLDQRWPLHGASDHLVSEALYLADPEGNGIEVYADRPRAAWTRSGGELRMATLPLDVDDLVREVDAAPPWNGLPAGTSMGHIHLRVSSLEAAEAFYHGLLGFDVTVRSYRGALFLSAGGYHHHLGVNVWDAPYAARTAPDGVGLLDFQVVLPAGKAAALLERLRERGVEPAAEGRGWRLRDPDGLAVVVEESR